MLLPRWSSVVLAALLIPVGAAQELDTFVFETDRKPFTMLDRIEDAKERAAFAALLVEGDASEKKRLAEEFRANYPQSWMLSQAYDVAAKASIDAGDYSRALLHGTESLKLLPENPLLLIPLANVQVQDGLLKDAERSAQNALEYLDRFERIYDSVTHPTQASRYSSAQQWEEIETQLRASGYFVLGRVAAARATNGDSNSRERWEQAKGFLVTSREYNRDDPLAAYLLGLAEQALGATDEAALSFADATRSENPVKTMALERLQLIYESGAGKAEGSLDEYLAARLSESGKKTIGPGKLPVEPEPEPLSYAGSASCKGCHDAEHSAWEQTGMARMLAPYKKANVIGDFESKNEFFDATGSPQVRMSAEDDGHYFAFRQADDEWKRYRVDYTIGSKWQQGYATQLPDGRIQVFPIQYNAPEKKWINFWKIIDDPGSERAVVSDFPKLSRVTNYQVNCAPCHTSQLRTVSGKLDPEDLEFREAGINCEMCHGPSAKHVEAMKGGKSYSKRPEQAPVEFSKIDHREHVAVCAQCHTQSAVEKPGQNGALNYSGTADFVKRYGSRPYVEFSKKAFYKDGRFRATTFIVESFQRSACFQQGKAHCGHCHDPHPSNTPSNPKSLKFLDRPDQMCVQCHSGYSSNLEAHTHHAASSEASRCTSCHMPRIMNSVLFKAGTHRIDDIPRAEPTLRFGPSESPNACLTCHEHEEKDAEWVRKPLASW